MFDESKLTRLLVSVFILIGFAATIILTLRTVFSTWKPYCQKLLSESPLMNEVVCPKCCSSSGLEPTGYQTLRCKNCGFTFSFGGGILYLYHPDR